MYVKDNMTKNPYTVSLDKSISEVLDIMSATKVHRLPVVDKSGKLLGLLTESLILSNTPNSSTSLSVFELNYLLNKLSVKDIMVKDPYTIGPDALLEDAATVMRKNGVACLPVVDDKKNLVGIITHNDIFDAFINLLGYYTDGSRYVINVDEDRIGVIEELASIFKDNNISISNIAVYHTERGIEIVVIVHGIDNICDELDKKGFKVTHYMHMHNNN